MFSFIAIKGPDTFLAGAAVLVDEALRLGDGGVCGVYFRPVQSKILRHSVRFIRVHRQFWPHQYSSNSGVLVTALGGNWHCFCADQPDGDTRLWILWRLRSALGSRA